MSIATPPSIHSSSSYFRPLPTCDDYPLGELAFFAIYGTNPPSTGSSYLRNASNNDDEIFRTPASLQTRKISFHSTPSDGDIYSSLARTPSPASTTDGESSSSSRTSSRNEQFRTPSPASPNQEERNSLLTLALHKIWPQEFARKQLTTFSKNCSRGMGNKSTLVSDLYHKIANFEKAQKEVAKTFEIETSDEIQDALRNTALFLCAAESDLSKYEGLINQVYKICEGKMPESKIQFWKNHSMLIIISEGIADARDSNDLELQEKLSLKKDELLDYFRQEKAEEIIGEIEEFYT